MTKEEQEIIFNKVHTTYSAAIYGYSKTNDFKKLQEITSIFQDFITLFQENIDSPLEDSEFLVKLSFRNIENDKRLLKKKTNK